MIDYFIKNIVFTFKRFFNETTKYSSVVQTDSSNDPIPEKTLILVTGGGQAKWLNFLCPCGCGKEIKLPLMTGFNPRWQITINPDKTLTLYPSVDVRKPGCASHFWIRNSKVQWAESRPSVFSHWFD